MIDTRERLTNLIWACIDVLRGRVAADEYPGFVFGIVFLKVLYDYRETLAERNGLDVPSALSWNSLFGSHDDYAFRKYLDDLANALPPEQGELIASIDIDRLSHVLGSDFVSLGRIVREFDFRDISREYAVETLSSIFENPSSKTLSAYYTSETVSNLLAKLAHLNGIKEVYDPACGTGRLLLNTYHEAKLLNPETDIRLYGQEIVSQTAMLARILMFVAGVENWSIRTGDTLISPRFLSASGSIRQFDTIVSALPFGIRISEDRERVIQRDHRFFGESVSIGDVLFLEHIVASLSPTGRATVIAAPGALFRSGIEGYKRQRIVEADLVEAVIELPNGVLVDTNISPAIVIFNRNKPERLQKRVLFVDAKQFYTKYHQRNIIDSEHQQRIRGILAALEEIDGVSRLVNIDEIASKSYVLVPSIYLNPPEPTLSGYLVKSAPRLRLQDIAEIYLGIRNSNIAIKGEGGTPIIQGRDLSSPNLTLDDLEKIRVVGEIKREISAKRGDLLIQRIGREPSTYLVEENLEGILVWDTAYVVRLNEDHQYLRRFLLEYLNSPVWYEYLNRTRMANIGAPTLKITELRQLSVPVPSLDSVAALEDLYSVERDMQTRLDKLRELKRSLFTIEDEGALQEQISQIAIRERIVIQTIEQAADFDYQIRNLYPYALAYPYRLLDANTVPAEKYREQLRVGENIMAFLGSIALALLVHNGLHAMPDLDWLKAELPVWWGNGISPGSWQSMGRRCSQALREHGPTATSGISDIWFRGKGAKASDFQNDLKKLGEILNDWKHDRGPKSTPGYRQAVVEAERLLKSCLEKASILTQYGLREVTSSNLDWKTKQIVVNTLVHMGDHPGHRQQQATSTAPLPDNHLYLLSSDQEWISLYPLLSTDFCSTCDAVETFMVDRWDGFGGRFVMKSFERGHVLDTSSKENQIALKVREDFEHFVRQIMGDAPTR